MSDSILYAPPSSSSRDTKPRASQPEQSYKNHTRVDAIFLAAIIILITNFFVVTVTAVRYDRDHFTWMTILWVAVAFATVVIGMKARTNAIKVQDRVIRLEERLRYATILPPSMAADAASLEIKQTVALRFASDQELPTLIERTLAESLTPKQIKQSIISWRPDHLRV